MVKRYLVGGLVTAAVFAGVTGCSRTPAQSATNDIFAPTPVPTDMYQPGIYQADVYQPVVVPPAQHAQVAPLQPAPLVAPQFVSQEAPLPAPNFDCNNIPTSKSGLTRYRESCL